jgi:hypothetical protein
VAEAGGWLVGGWVLTVFCGAEQAVVQNVIHEKQVLYRAPELHAAAATATAHGAAHSPSALSEASGPSAFASASGSGSGSVASGSSAGSAADHKHSKADDSDAAAESAAGTSGRARSAARRGAGGGWREHRTERPRAGVHRRGAKP